MPDVGRKCVDEMEGPSIMYAVHPFANDIDERGDSSTRVNVTKLVWDVEAMRYQRSGDPKRAASAPITTNTASPHLQKLFKAAHESSGHGRALLPRRSHTASYGWLFIAVHVAFAWLIMFLWQEKLW